MTTVGVDFPYFDSNGTPQGSNPNFVEHFWVSEDGSRLEYQITATDEEIFTEPVTLTKDWVWRPGEQVRPYVRIGSLFRDCFPLSIHESQLTQNSPAHRRELASRLVLVTFSPRHGNYVNERLWEDPEHSDGRGCCAVVLAMRDAAALIIMQMDKATGISKLNREPLPSAARPEPELPEPVKEESQTTASKDTTDETG